jgi:thioredoxin reductase
MNSPMSDVVIVGAGPYGLSIAAHLAGGKLQSRIFGTPMQSWSNHMPRGMKLKSEGFASSLYDPASIFPLRQYCSENNLPYQDVGLPVPLETFTAYGLEFQRRLVPHLEQTDILAIQRTPGGFALQTASGETLQARNVVIATGITHFAQTPPPLAALPASYVSHTSDHNDLSSFHGRKVAVLGAGSSAIDTAALLRDAGAEVQIIARASSIAFHSPGSEPRPFLERLKNPRSGLGVGWKSKLCSDLPLLFHALPAKLRIRAVKRHLGPSSGWFVREKVEGHIPMHLNSSIQSAHVENNQVHLTLKTPQGPTALTVDHVIAGTGFYPTLSRLQMLDAELRSAIHTVDDAPILSRQFESSVPGLYFVGLASSISFGPLARFACGAEFTAKYLTQHLNSRVPTQ